MTKTIKLLKLFFVSFLLSISDCGNQKEKIICKKTAEKKSFLWALKREPPAYFFGTIHVPYTQVWNHVSQTVKKAFDGSENVFFELDLTDAATLTALTRCQLLPKNTGLHEVLPTELYRRLKRHLEYIKFTLPEWVTMEQKEKGLHADTLYEAIVGNWERKKPIWVMLMVNSLTKADIKTRGTPVLDLHLARKAEKMGKKIGAVEKVDEQCKPLNSLNMSQVLFALNHTLLVQEKLRQGKMEMSYTTDDLINQYNCGNLDAVVFDKETVQISSLTNRTQAELTETESPKNGSDELMSTDIDLYFKNELIYERNQRMAERVKQLLDENPGKSYFFAFGAGHFLGNGSVIDFLKQYGYQIESVDNEILYRNKSVSNVKKKQNKRTRRKRKRNHRLRKRQNRWSKRSKNKQRNKKHFRKDFQTLSNQRRNFKVLPSFNGGLQIDGSYTFLDQPDIRIINHFPTVVPPGFFRDLTHSRTNYKSHLRSSHFPWRAKERLKKRRRKKDRFQFATSETALNSDLKNLGFKLWKQSTTSVTATGSSTTFQTGFYSFTFIFYWIQISTVVSVVYLF